MRAADNLTWDNREKFVDPSEMLATNRATLLHWAKPERYPVVQDAYFSEAAQGWCRGTRKADHAMATHA